MFDQQVNILEFINNSEVNKLSVEQQLINAQKEIDDLKLQLQWLERSYE